MPQTVWSTVGAGADVDHTKLNRLIKAWLAAPVPDPVHFPSPTSGHIHCNVLAMVTFVHCAGTSNSGGHSTTFGPDCSESKSGHVICAKKTEGSHVTKNLGCRQNLR